MVEALRDGIQRSDHSERNEGDVHFVTISLGGKPGTRTASRNGILQSRSNAGQILGFEPRETLRDVLAIAA